MDEMAAVFDVTAVNPNPARFDQKKADAINAAHIRLLNPEEFRQRLVPYLQSAGLIEASPSDTQLAILEQAAPLIQERITVLGESVPMLEFLFVDSAQLEIQEDALAGLPENAAELVRAALASLELISDAEFKTETIQNALQTKLVDEMGEKPRNAFGPLRTAISGKRVSPPLFESMEILGKRATIERLRSFAEGQ